MNNTQITPKGSPRRDWRLACVAVACVTGAVSLTLIAAMAVNYLRLRDADPLASPKLAGMKEALYEHPADEQLKDDIRRLDLRLRKAHLRLRTRLATGGLLLGSILIVLVVSIRAAEILGRKPPHPNHPHNDPKRDDRIAGASRWSLIALTAAIGCGAAAWAMLSEPSGDTLLPAHVNGQKPEPDYPTPEEVRKNWPRFRGPGGAGVSAYANIPVSWNVETGENILWKTPVPLGGMNSPVAWGNRVFLAGAKKRRREVYCFDAETGRLLWTRRVQPAGSKDDPENVDRDTGLSAPTCSTDGKRLYAIFPNGDLASFDFSGKEIWSRNLGVPDNIYGYATSLLTWRGRLIVQSDQGTPDDALSVLLILDAATGKTLRTIRRAVAGSWTTPAVFSIGGAERLVTVGDPWVITYDPADGRETWRARLMGPDVAPSPIYSAGLVFTVTAEAKLSAIRPGGTGDVTDSHVAWSATEDLPGICSPVSDGTLLYTLTSEGGVLTCYEAATGKRIWSKEYENLGFHSSPSLAGGRLYLFSRDGTAIVLESARRYKELARMKMGEGIHTSPAFLDGRMFVRGVKNLFCISGGKK